MGTLVAMRYPTTMFLKLADHTYVECGTGRRAWACWGGKTGGTALRAATGSTRRADTIAQPDERANITCYLINGVCHQAANRILLPARITVRGAKGYSISEALFGPYGRPGGWFCPGLFPNYSHVNGDLPACTPDVAATEGAEPDEEDAEYAVYLARQLELYEEAESIFAAGPAERDQVVEFAIDLFRNMAAFQLGGQFERGLEQRLLDIRRRTERQRVETEDAYAGRDLKPAEFAQEFDALTETFQDEMAEALTAQQYRMLFDLPRDERVTLADPDIVRGLEGPSRGVEE